MSVEVIIGIGLAFLMGSGVIGFRIFTDRKENGGVSKKEKYIPTTQDHLAIDYIRGGIVKLKEGGYRMIVEVPSVNISLREPGEKEGIKQQYKQILNSLDFPFQELEQSRVVDVGEHLDDLDKKAKGERNTLVKKQLENYREFVKDLIRDNSILTKRFYFVIPYDPEKEKNKSKYDKEKKKKEKANDKGNKGYLYEEEKRYEKARKQLVSRATSVERSFRSFEVQPKILNDEELLSLFYTAYNKDRTTNQSIRTKSVSDYTSLHVKEG